jgi:hypothetical protein
MIFSKEEPIYILLYVNAQLLYKSPVGRLWLLESDE